MVIGPFGHSTARAGRAASARQAIAAMPRDLRKRMGSYPYSAARTPGSVETVLRRRIAATPRNVSTQKIRATGWSMIDSGLPFSKPMVLAQRQLEPVPDH